MKYQKPEIVLVASASDAIQAGDKGRYHVEDQELKLTNGAYEADE